jgi:methylmalonyl-CoA/ethylmalonyl-CoA epimerase
MIKRVHHIGIAVNNLKESAALFEKVLGTKAHYESAPCQKVSEAVFKIGEGAEIDLLEPTGPESAVAKYLEKRGEGLHHIGIAVNNLKESAALFEKVLGTKAHYESAPCQKVSEAVFKIGKGAEIDLLEPTGPESAVAKYLEKRGEGIHHVAFRVENLDAALEELKAKGVRLIDEKPRIGVGGARIAFLHPQATNGILVELCERDH